MEQHTQGPIYSLSEEIAHALTHGLGLVASVGGLVTLVAAAWLRGDAWHIAGGSIFGATLVLLYASSTLYHGSRSPRVKRLFQRFDHAAIFLLIAGTYTPYTLVTLGGRWGWSMFGVTWGLAIVGILLETISRGRLRRLQLVMYLALGWIIVIAARPLVQSLSTGGLALLMAGGLFYTLGVTFFVWRRLRFHHAVWHVFVLGGSICHFFSVLLYVIP